MNHHGGAAPPFAPGEPAWVELCTARPDQAEAFFRALMGWTVRREQFGQGAYRICEAGGHDVAGIIDSALLHAGRRHGWITYFAVDDIESAIDRATSLGATVLLEPRHLPAAGTGATIVDPQGAVLGLYEAGARAGVEALNSIGSLCWNEISTGDPAGTAAFYGALFGFTADLLRSSTGQPYSVLKLDGQPVAGLLTLESAWPNELPARWVPYFNVATLADAIDRVVSLGGASVIGPVSSPNGTLHVVHDSEENPLYLIELESSLRTAPFAPARQAGPHD
ncbi:VOC family protein [Nocardioides daejeonensis]|uniref:VOC family protein n=1 Tax=Nocardioides daejeonensis TaxID=1046556 RepID=UPI000D74127E|nr:VOC family protein [Nocardioides daejeonensis]